MKQHDESLRGRKCIGLVRTSTGGEAKSEAESIVKQRPISRCVIVARGRDDDTDNQLDQQVTALRRFAHQNGMVTVDEVRLPNASADGPEVISALAELSKRKRTRDDYDLVLIESLCRLTRSGVCHGMHLVQRFRRLGVSIMTVDGGVVGSEAAKSFLYRRYYRKRGSGGK